MKYLKKPLTTSQIIDVLKERGLSIEDEEKAGRYLEHVSYFRFASYLRPMEIDSKSHDLKRQHHLTKHVVYMSLI